MREIPITEFDHLKIGNAENAAAGTGCTVLLFGEDGAPCDPVVGWQCLRAGCNNEMLHSIVSHCNERGSDKQIHFALILRYRFFKVQTA